MTTIRHGTQILIGLDQLVNTLTGGWADETLSSRAYQPVEKVTFPLRSE